MPFSGAIARSEKQTDWSSIYIWVTYLISYDDNRYAKHDS